MFGYVFPDKPELKIREFDEYRAVYCSLCFALRRLGPFAKYLLNYDFVFAAMLAMSLDAQTLETARVRCNTNPLEKVNAAQPDERLMKCAAALVVAAHHKLLDDVRDERFFRSLAARLAVCFTRSAYKKSAALCEGFDSLIAKGMRRQSELEAKPGVSLDEVCEPTASGLAFLFSQMSESEREKAELSRFGYLIGRFVYLADAADDLQKDAKRRRFNPALLKYPDVLTSDESAKAAADELHASLYLTIAQCEESYRLLDIKSYKEILDNIVYRGLRRTADEAGKAKERKSKR